MHDNSVRIGNADVLGGGSFVQNVGGDSAEVSSTATVGDGE